jgi:RHS repeat-associated protein
VLANYLYDPFGNTVAMSGGLAERNLYRFSSKEWHENSALVYYGFRYYNN